MSAPHIAHDFWVTITGPRGEEWTRIAGTNRFPVDSPIPRLGNLPGLGERRIYLLALEQMDPTIVVRIIDHLTRKFEMSKEEAAEEVGRMGIPILEDDCMVTILNPQKWF